MIRSLRERVSEAMVRVHLIPSELADYHVSEMAPDELRRRHRMYAKFGLAKRLERFSEMELSVAGATLRAGNVPSTRLCTPRDDDGTLAALNPVSGAGLAPTHARFGGRSTGSEGRGVFCRGHLPESETDQPGRSATEIMPMAEERARPGGVAFAVASRV